MVKAATAAFAGFVSGLGLGRTGVARMVIAVLMSFLFFPTLPFLALFFIAIGVLGVIELVNQLSELSASSAHLPIFFLLGMLSGALVMSGLLWGIWLFIVSALFSAAYDL